MALTYTPKGLPQWSAGSDSPTRAVFDAAFATLDATFAGDTQGLASSRPAPGVVGRFYTTTDAGTAGGIVYRDNGSSWQCVGANVNNLFTRPATATSVSAAIQGASGQTANLVELRNSAGTVLAAFTAAAQLKAPSAIIGASPTSPYSGWTAGTQNLAVVGSSIFQGQLTVVDAGGGGKFAVAQTGTVNAPYGITSNALSPTVIVRPSGSTTQTGYSRLSNENPISTITYTAPPSGKLKISISGYAKGTSGSAVFTGYELAVGGTVTQAWTDDNAYRLDGGQGDQGSSGAFTDLVTGLSPGATYFIYFGSRVTSGSATFSRHTFVVEGAM